MNEPAEVAERADGYVQDPASQQVAAAVGAGPGDLVLDLCAAPGGKATALAVRAPRSWPPTTACAAPPRGRQRRARGVAAGAVRARGRRRPPAAARRRRRPRAGGRPVLRPGNAAARPDLRWRVEPGPVERLSACSDAGGRGRRPGPPGRRARLLGVHADRRGVDRCRRLAWPSARPRARCPGRAATGRPGAGGGRSCCPRPPAPTVCACSATAGRAPATSPEAADVLPPDP